MLCSHLSRLASRFADETMQVVGVWSGAARCIAKRHFYQQPAWQWQLRDQALFGDHVHHGSRAILHVEFDSATEDATLPSCGNGSGQMHASLLLRASLRLAVQRVNLAGGAGTIAQQQVVPLRQASTQPVVAKASEGGEGSRANSNSSKAILYPAAALIAFTSVAAAKAHQQPQVQGDDQSSSLFSAQWVQKIPQQPNVLQVLSAKTIETHPLLTKDHIVSLACAWQSSAQSTAPSCSSISNFLLYSSQLS